ncbi:MAG: FAD-dependent oxidoreductase [Candidatus Sumerlaeota bacterium]|nr:FAD-dependent oxidoreductase [Candidatus Sumerlaeota bacterium]
MGNKRTGAVSRRRFVAAAGSAAALTAVFSADVSQSLAQTPAQTLAQNSAQNPVQNPAPQSARKGPVFDDVDVLIVGGGPAGIGAALAASLKGAKTMLVENQAFFGGVGAWCMGMPINQMRPSGKPRSKVHELLIQKLLTLGDQAVRIGQHQLWCNVDYLKVAALDALDEAGCRYLVHSRAVDAIVESGRVAGVVVATKQGLSTIRAKSVVDCTGDADVAFFAGAETMKETGALSPMTLCLGLCAPGGANPRKANIGDIVRKAREKYPLIPKGWGLSPVANSNACFYINHAGTKELGQFDATDPAQWTKAESLSRRQAVQMVQAMREFGGDEIKNIELTGTGPQLGVRETRRVKGVYILTEDDAKNGSKFEDVIAWRSGFLDVGFVRFEKMKIHDVPYRAILPEKIEGLLVAGRCISATHIAASAGKSMGNCMASGHAAGLSAAMSGAKGCQPRELSVKELQSALRADGVDLTLGGQEQQNVDSKG